MLHLEQVSCDVSNIDLEKMHNFFSLLQKSLLLKCTNQMIKD